MKPLFKIDNLDLNVFKNYRPASNISFISKVLGKVAVKRLTNYLDINGLQEEDYQSAYKLMHSTETTLLKVKHDISSALDRHNSVLFVMLDLSAAFDTIYQNQLLSLLRDEYGITGKALSWFSTYPEACIKEIRIWMSIRMLKLNDDKTEMVIFCSKHHLGQYGHCTINIGDSTIIPVSHVRNLGVQMNYHLSMINQVTAICATCNFPL